MSREPRPRKRRPKGARLESLLDALENAQLVRRLDEPDPAYLFRHALIQETACESLLAKRRRAVHRSVAETYEELYSGQLDDYAALLAQHYWEAGDEPKAIEYSRRAGDAAGRVYAHAEAVLHYSRALELVTNQIRREGGLGADLPLLVHLYVSRGTAFERSGQYDSALANYQEMETFARQYQLARLELAALIAHATIRSTPTSVFNVDEGQALCDKALVLAHRLGDWQAEVKALWNLMLLNQFAGHYDEAIRFGEQSLALARQFNLREQLAYALNDMGRAYGSTGRLDRARAALDEARPIWRELGLVPMLTDSLTTSAIIEFSTGDLDRALALAQEALQLSRSINNLWGEAFSLELAGYVYGERGEVGEAIQALLEAISLGEQSGYLHPSTAGRAGLAMLYVFMGAIDRALEQVQLGLQVAAAHSVPWELTLRSMRVQLYIEQGDLAAANAAAEDVQRLSGQAEYKWSMDFSLTPIVAGELALANGDVTRAISIADAIVESARQADARLYVSDALYQKGRALLAEGAVDEARRALFDAREVASAIGSRRTLCMILATLADVESSRGNQAEAAAARDQAREIVDYIAGHAGSPELRASFLNLPLVQRIVKSGSKTNGCSGHA